jgi:hypothetical protein
VQTKNEFTCIYFQFLCTLNKFWDPVFRFTHEYRSGQSHTPLTSGTESCSNKLHDQKSKGWNFVEIVR